MGMVEYTPRPEGGPKVGASPSSSYSSLRLPLGLGRTTGPSTGRPPEAAARAATGAAALGALHLLELLGLVVADQRADLLVGLVAQRAHGLGDLVARDLAGLDLLAHVAALVLGLAHDLGELLAVRIADAEGL